MAETPFSLADKLLGWCFTVLLAALALKVAVDLIAGIWPWLVVECYTFCGQWRKTGLIEHVRSNLYYVRIKGSVKSSNSRSCRVVVEKPLHDQRGGKILRSGPANREDAG